MAVFTKVGIAILLSSRSKRAAARRLILSKPSSPQET